MSLAEGQSPFKFLDSYGAGDKDIFFGREREVEEVYDKVFQSKLLLVYGASGTGKSSIINCGLANKFDESDWFPIRIRRGGNINRSLFNQIEKEAIQKVDLSEDEKTTNYGLQKVINSVYLDHFKPIYLIFDQFEELFIFGFKDEWSNFISSIRFLMNTDLDLHFIFIIRGEYLEFLSEFEELIPDFFDNRVRVEKMTRKKAEETIKGPARKFEISIQDGFEDLLLKKISPDKSHIELTFLQVFLDKIYKSATGRASGEVLKFTHKQLEELGQLGDVLAEFVDEQLFQMEDPKAALTVLKSFVSLQGTKIQNSLKQVRRYCHDLGYPLPEKDVAEIIRSFINKRILKDHDDNGNYELRHDSLAEKIFEKITNQEKELLDVKQFLSYSLNEYQKRGTLLNDEDIGYVGYYERNLEVNTEMRAFIEVSKKNSVKRLRERKTRRAVVMVIILLFITSLLGLFYSQAQKRKAEELAHIARTEKLNAENQKLVAEGQREIAVTNEQAAKEQAEIANNQRVLADRARREADNQRNLALNQKSIAESERTAAEIAREEALASKNEALQQKSIAEEQRQLALRLRSLAIAKSIATKSTYLANNELKALLSLQSLDFNNQYGGNPYDADIYQALYDARQAFFPEENISKQHSSAIAEFAPLMKALFFSTTNGELGVVRGQEVKVLFTSKYVFESMAVINNNKLALGSQGGTMVIYDLERSSTESTLQLHKMDVTKILDSDSSMMSCSLDGTINFYNKETRESHVRYMEDKVIDMVLSREGLWILSGKNQLSLLDRNSLKSFQLTNSVLTKLIYEPASHSLFLGSQSGEIYVWSIEAAAVTKILSGHSSSITDLKVSDGGAFLASSSLDRTARVWPISHESIQPIVLADHDNWVSALSFDAESHRLITSSYSGTIKYFELDMNLLATDLCKRVGRSLSKSEWAEYVGDELQYQITCDE